AAPSAKGDDKFITTDYLQQCHSFSIIGCFCRTTTVFILSCPVKKIVKKRFHPFKGKIVLRLTVL
ncbi:hypothetical protein, partial [Citrobacter freundii]